MAITVRELVTTWGFNVDFATLRAMDQRIGTLRKETRSLGAEIQNIGRGISTTGRQLTTFVTLPILGIGAAISKAAIEAEETESKFNTVFRDISDAANQTVTDLRQGFGLSRQSARQLLGDTGDLLTGFNFSQKAALDLSTEVQKLAVDLASFTNVEGGAERASRALTKALLGERESVKELGIAILEEDVKARVKQLEAAGRFTDESERQRKAIATLLIAQEQSGNAIGDFARTSDSTANQIRLLGQDLEDLGEDLGKELIPAVRRGVTILRGLVKAFGELSPETKSTIINFAGILAIGGPVLILLGTMISSAVKLTQTVFALTKAFGALKAGITFLKVAAALGNQSLLAFIGSMLLAIAIPALLAAAIFLLVDDIIGIFTGKKTFFGDIVGDWIWRNITFPIINGIEIAIEQIKKVPQQIREGLSTAFEQAKKAPADIGKGLKTALEGAKEALGFGDTDLGDDEGVRPNGGLDVQTGITPATSPAATAPAAAAGATVNAPTTLNLSVQAGPGMSMAEAEDVGRVAGEAARRELEKRDRKILASFPEPD